MPLTTARPSPRILLIGYGNPGRGDDGLGPALAAELEASGIRGLTVDIDYQLTVDHAALIAAHDVVVFADAMIGLATPFRFAEVDAAPPATLGSHQVSPEAALALAGLLFGHAPPGWMLAIAGEDFGEVKEGLSRSAIANLARAVAFLRDWIDPHGLVRSGHPTIGLPRDGPVQPAMPAAVSGQKGLPLANFAARRANPVAALPDPGIPDAGHT